MVKLKPESRNRKNQRKKEDLEWGARWFWQRLFE